MKQKTKFKETEIGKIPEEWEIVEMGNLGTLKNGINYNSSAEGEGLLVVSVKQLFRGEYVLLEGLGSVQKEKISNYKNFLLKNGDLLFARSSLKREGAGKLAIVKDLDNENTVFSGFIIRFRNESNNDNLFLNYLLRSPKYREMFPRIANGTTITNLTQDVLDGVPLIIPPLPEQKAIASILSSLDAKIELNNKMNKTLEAIGQAVFRRWFVDGKKEGWEVGKLGEIGKIQPGFAFKSSDFVNEGCKLIKIKNIQNSIIDIDNIESFLPEEIFNIIDEKFYLRSGDILIAMTGAKLGKVGIIQKTEDKILLNQRVGKVVSKNSVLFYFYLVSPEIQGLFKGISSASSAQGNISNSDIEGIDIFIPDKEIIKKFTETTKRLFELLIYNLKQNQTLSQIRDALLPKLMSGEVRV